MFVCAGSSLLCGLFSLAAASGGYFLVAVLRPLVVAASLVEHRFSGSQASVVEAPEL